MRTDRYQQQRHTSRKRLRISLAILVLLVLASFLLSQLSGETTTPEKPILLPLADLVPNIEIPYEGRVVANTPRIESNDQFSGGTIRIIHSPGGEINIQFKGTGIEWVAYRGEYAGSAEIYLDNTFVTLVDAYQPLFEKEAVLFATDGLSNGIHELSIRATGDKQPNARSFQVSLDYFRIWMGEDLRIVQDDSIEIAYVNGNLYNYLHFIFRKIIHVTMFFAITLVLLLLMRYNSWSRWIPYLPVIVLIWAGLDEFHQSFISGRTSSLIDVALDGTGMLLAIIPYYVLRLSKRKDSYS